MNITEINNPQVKQMDPKERINNEIKYFFIFLKFFIIFKKGIIIIKEAKKYREIIAISGLAPELYEIFVRVGIKPKKKAADRA